MTVRLNRRGAREWRVPDVGPWPHGADDYNVIVIGAGLAGLAAAATLAKRGCKVLVVEAHDRPGGHCSSWRRTVGVGGRAFRFVFDSGVQDISGLGTGGSLRTLLDEVGATQLEWRRVRHRYFVDNLRLDVPEEPIDLASLLGKMFPDEMAGIGAFFDEVFGIYNELYADANGRPLPPNSLNAVLAWPATHPRAWKWINRPWSELLDFYLRAPVLKQLLSMLSDYVSDEPERLRVSDMVPLFGYYLHGGWYPLGGALRLPQALARSIREHNGTILFRQKVRQIVVDSGRVAGIVTEDGLMRRAPVVVANGDVVSLATSLVDPQYLPENWRGQIAALRRGPSAVLLSLGLDCLPDLPARVIALRQGVKIGIGNPSSIDRSLAAPGHAAVTVLRLLPENAMSNLESIYPDHRAAQECLTENLLDVVEAVIPDVRRHIIYRQCATPRTFARYALTPAGNIYGAARGQWLPGLKTPVPGLFSVGAAGALGPGIEAVVLSGLTAADMITSGQG